MDPLLTLPLNSPSLKGVSTGDAMASAFLLRGQGMDAASAVVDPSGSDEVCAPAGFAPSESSSDLLSEGI